MQFKVRHANNTATKTYHIFYLFINPFSASFSTVRDTIKVPSLVCTCRINIWSYHSNIMLDTEMQVRSFVAYKICSMFSIYSIYKPKKKRKQIVYTESHCASQHTATGNMKESCEQQKTALKSIYCNFLSLTYFFPFRLHSRIICNLHGIATIIYPFSLHFFLHFQIY